MVFWSVNACLSACALHERAGVGADDQEVGAGGRCRRRRQRDARDLRDLVVDVVVDLEDGCAHQDRAHHDGDDDPSGERAQPRREGDLTVRSWYRRPPVEETRVARYRLTVRRSDTRRVRAPRPAPARGGGRRGASRRRHGRRRGTRRRPGGLGSGRVRRPRPARPGLLGGLVRVRARPRGRTGRRPGARRSRPRTVPDAVFARFDAHAVVAADGRVTVHGDGSGTGRARARRGAPSTPSPRAATTSVPWPAAGGGRASTATPTSARVETVLELLRAGECYQVNLTRRLTCDRRARPGRALRRASPARTRRRTPRCCACPGSDPAPRSCRRRPSGYLRRVAARRSRPARSRAPPPTARALRDQRQGPRRERDDRRPRPQRPRAACACPGRCRCRRSARSRRTPGCTTS